MLYPWRSTAAYVKLLTVPVPLSLSVPVGYRCHCWHKTCVPGNTSLMWEFAACVVRVMKMFAWSLHVFSEAVVCHRKALTNSQRRSPPVHIHFISPTDSHAITPQPPVPHRLLQVWDEDTDDQRVGVNVVHAVLRWLGDGPYGLVNGFLTGAVRGTVVRVVWKALGHLILTGGGAPGHNQQARWVQLGQTSREEKRSHSHKTLIVY